MSIGVGPGLLSVKVATIAAEQTALMFSTGGCVGVKVAVLVGVLVGVAVAVLVGVAVAVAVLVGVAVGGTHVTVLVAVTAPVTLSVRLPEMPLTVSVVLPPAGTETVLLWTVAPLPSTMVYGASTMPVALGLFSVKVASKVAEQTLLMFNCGTSVGVAVLVGVAVAVAVLVGVAVGGTHVTVLVAVTAPVTLSVRLPEMPLTVSVVLPPAGTETVPLSTVAPLPSTMVYGASTIPVALGLFSVKVASSVAEQTLLMLSDGTSVGVAVLVGVAVGGGVSVGGGVLVGVNVGVAVGAAMQVAFTLRLAEMKVAET